jgi:ferrous iron transport protein B
MLMNANKVQIALAGNPNCGKTTLFNALTGLHHKVANYPGVTVEKKEGVASLNGFGDVQVLDLPGIYSLSAHSVDESVATQILLGTSANDSLPNVVIAVVDASNLERNLYLVSQLIDLGVPLVVALNMSDIAVERGILIKREILSRLLGVPVVALAASKKTGVAELQREIINQLTTPQPSPNRFAWLPKDSLYLAVAKEIGSREGNHAPELLGSLMLSDAVSPQHPENKQRLHLLQHSLEHAHINPLSFEATKRYEWIKEVISRACAQKLPPPTFISERIDAFVVHKIWGTVLFVSVMALMFQAIFVWATFPMSIIEHGVAWLSTQCLQLLPAGPLRSLLCDGIIAGVGSVLVFVPQIVILFLFLGLLEDSGYLSRAAFLMDKIMRRFGLQGRSFVPLLTSFACAVPGIMATRTIPSFADRMTTILVAPLMSCSARLPVYTLLIAAFIPQGYLWGFLSIQGLVLLGMYVLGMGTAAVVAGFLKRSLFHGASALFVMEMPPLRIPTLRTVLREIFDRVVLFLKTAGTVILACSVVLWFLVSYPQGEPQDSFAGRLGRTLEPALAPLGFNWEIGVGIVASFAAREVFVSALATVYNVTDSKDSSSESLSAVLQRKHREGTFNTPTAVSLLVFYIFACQCISTLAVCRRETGSWKWSLFMFGYMGTLAYIAALVAYRLSTFLLS